MFSMKVSNVHNKQNMAVAHAVFVVCSSSGVTKGPEGGIV